MSRQGRLTRDGTGWAFDIDVGPTGARRKRIVRTGFGTKAEASEAMETQRTRFAHVRNPTELTVGDYLLAWVEDRYSTGRIRESTARGYRQQMGVAAAWLTGVRLNRLTAADLDRFYRDIFTVGTEGGTGRGLSASTVAQYHRVIKTALHDAARKGLVGRNEADYADPPKVEPMSPDRWSLWEPDEVVSFLTAPWLPDHRRIMWETAFGTGFRRGEMAGLYWSDLDGGALTVRRARVCGMGGRPYLSPPKSAHGYRTVPIHPVLAERLDEWRAVQANQLFAKGLGPQYVFTNSELGPWFPSGITHHWRQDVKRALAEGRVSTYGHLHMIRHWYGTQLFAVGTDLPTARAQMGHHSATFTANVYGHADPRRAREAGEKVGALLWSR